MTNAFKPSEHAPLLVFGGPYSNLQATQALQKVAHELSIPAENIICTGDLVAYCAQPEETVSLIREWGIAVVAGNCEDSIGNEAADCGCGFEEGTTCDLLSAEWYNYTLPRVSESNKQWMRQLPADISFSYQGISFIAIHGALQSNNQFIFSSTSKTEKGRQISQSKQQVILAGHCGLPFGEQLPEGCWLNAGVIGMPANNGSPDTWYMLVSPTPQGVEASWHKLEYDYLHTTSEMQNAGLNNGYAEALSTGLWPSLDVLPETEKQSAGVEIQLPPLSILK